MRTFDEKILLDRLVVLPITGKVLFAASCATRLFSAYRFFHDRTGFGDPSSLRAALDAVWDWIFGRQKPLTVYEQQVETVIKLIPGEAPGWTPLQAYAEDAASAVAYAIGTLLRNDAKQAAWAARRVY